MSVLKNTIKEITHRASLSDMVGQTYPLYACTGIKGVSTRVFSSLHSVFCGGWKQGILN